VGINYRTDRPAFADDIVLRDALDAVDEVTSLFVPPRTTWMQASGVIS
jgi:hypothetical protein